MQAHGFHHDGDCDNEYDYIFIYYLFIYLFYFYLVGMFEFFSKDCQGRALSVALQK